MYMDSKSTKTNALSITHLAYISYFRSELDSTKMNGVNNSIAWISQMTLQKQSALSIDLIQMSLEPDDYHNRF